jgi:acid phosphatase
LNSVTNNADRLTNIKNTTFFFEGLANNELALDVRHVEHDKDGHDISVTTAGIWLKPFSAPLLEGENFIQNTLVLITFDENETYTIQTPSSPSSSATLCTPL